MGLAFVGLMLWAEWQKEQAEINNNSVTNSPISTSSLGSATPVKTRKENSTREPLHINKKAKALEVSQQVSKDTITVTTDLLEVKIDKMGGSIVDAVLLKHYIDSEKTDNYRLFNSEPNKLYLAEMGLVLEENVLPRTKFVSNKNNFTMDKNKDILVVTLTGLQGDNVFIERTYKFTRGKHSVDIGTKVSNNGTKEWQGGMYYQLIRKEVDSSVNLMPGMSSYLGGAISDENKKLYEKVPFDSIRQKPLNRKVISGWVAMQEHYFLTSYIPTKNTENTFYSQEFSNNQFGLGYSTNYVNISPGENNIFNSTLYVGPEYSDELNELSPGLELTIDYGWLWFISGFLFKALKMIHNVVQNWGWSIIILTMIIKGLFYKLSSSSYRSMARMKKFQPKLQALKEKYGDDKQKLNQAVMEVYKKEKINPLGGCLPILIQIPVFIALYWVLLESVELRHSPFIFWIADLSSKDPYYVLPILMGSTMFLQQRLSPPPADPVQAKVMGFLPVIFTFLFISVPAGLVLYWTINNLLSIAQQWYITNQQDAVSK
ncbi:MAG: membrane protein insertase YidC, partial [Legionellales bacterium]|nr:membrane protein insertase YidC [Legionellales bacterium]